MDRKLFGLFSGTQLTVLALAAIITPGVVTAAVTYSNVAVVNPSTGVAASVSPSGWLTATNPYSLWKDYAANQIEIAISNNGSGCEASQAWPVPNGKAFIITAISGYETNIDTTTNSTGFHLFANAGTACSGLLLTSHFSTVTNKSVYEGTSNPIASEYGTGIPVPSGNKIVLYSSNNYGYTYIHGYLVPASWVTSLQHAAAAAVTPTTKKLH